MVSSGVRNFFDKSTNMLVHVGAWKTHTITEPGFTMETPNEARALWIPLFFKI
jgi:hypothetical protein